MTLGQKVYLKNMKMMITGHRPSKLNNEYNLDGPMSFYLKNEITKLVRFYKPTQIISGMALGVDTLFALIGLNEKIPVLAAIPFVGQERMWPVNSRTTYYEILKDPLTTSHIVCEGGYAAWKMQKRNKFMVDLLGEGDLAIAVWDGTPGGTGNCVKYLNEVGKTVIRIDPNDRKKYWGVV